MAWPSIRDVTVHTLVLLLAGADLYDKAVHSYPVHDERISSRAARTTSWRGSLDVDFTSDRVLLGQGAVRRILASCGC